MIKGYFMSILIKGIKIPKRCIDCPFNPSSLYCSITHSEIDRDDEYYDRLPDCPIVELPEHHGRLIDADRLLKIYENRMEKVADRYGHYSSEAGILSGAMKLLMIELGIVEAE